MKTVLTYISILILQLSFGQTRPLFKIVENDKVGYINDKGKVIIKPAFLSGNDFSEGLAAVRENGLYGYINESGFFTIKPEYDFATNFVKGLVVVYKNGTPFFINKKGEIALPTCYKALTFLDDRKGIITTRTNKQGVIDVTSKKLLIDTVFSSIGDFKYGVAIVSEITLPSQKQRKERIAVIDTSGKLIVPFGKFETIKQFNDGFACVEIDDKKNKDGSTDGVIDTKGNLLFKRPYKNNSSVDGDFHDGYAKVSLYKYWIPEKEGITSTSEKDYEGFINLKGEVVFNDTNSRYVKDFSSGRAFIKEDNSDYILIGRDFKRISKTIFRDVLNNTFKNGYAIVETSNGYGIIDTSGNFVLQPQYYNIDRVGLVDGYFFYTNDAENDKTLFGISDLNGNIICKPIMKEFDRSGFVNGLIKAIINEQLTYINKNGEIVWKQKEDTLESLQYLNIDFMNRGYFYAYSSPKNSEADESGGWATSSNKPNKITNLNFLNNLLTITIDTTRINTFANKFSGYQLFISNATADTIKFNAQDSRLYMKLQAQNENGEWKDIEYLPNSWCGNSYHKIELEPKAFWSFTIPNYHGENQTKIRAELKYIDKLTPKKDKIIYSNIISGGINPGQFWNKRQYNPGGLMDPYND